MCDLSFDVSDEGTRSKVNRPFIQQTAPEGELDYLMVLDTKRAPFRRFVRWGSPIYFGLSPRYRTALPGFAARWTRSYSSPASDGNGSRSLIDACVSRMDKPRLVLSPQRLFT